MTDIREQILDRCHEFADTMEKLLAENEQLAAENKQVRADLMESIDTTRDLQAVYETADVYRKHMKGEIKPVQACGIHLDDAIAAVKACDDGEQQAAALSEIDQL